MSGIDAIKRKTKMSLDELYEEQPSRKLDVQNSKEPAIQQVDQPELPQEYSQPVPQLCDPAPQNIIQPLGVMEDNTQIVRQDALLNSNQGSQMNQQTQQYIVAKRPPAKIVTYKMTFALPEDMYQAFNDLYARRMLEGRKTNKSEMICEAIQWLVQNEH
jgi:hypothetical protein